jgi:hypothetical protein
MRGHEGIIRMRKEGRKPGMVFLNDQPCHTDWEQFGSYPNIEISPTEQPEWLDLRFLVGLRVSVTGSTEKRAKRLSEACKKAGAITVAACHVEKTLGKDYGTQLFSTGWTEIWHKEPQNG